jgi:hypothetical protein
MSPANDNLQIKTSLVLLERAALVAIAGIGLGGLFGLVVGYRLGRRRS